MYLHLGGYEGSSMSLSQLSSELLRFTRRCTGGAAQIFPLKTHLRLENRPLFCLSLSGIGAADFTVSKIYTKTWNMKMFTNDKPDCQAPVAHLVAYRT